jgi:CMP-N-acetylneuraminic acid synthetase
MKIRSALASEKIGLVVVSSPDDDIKKHVELHYKDNSKVIFHHRPIELARLNTGLVETTNTILKLADVQSFSPELLMILSPEYPLISTHTLEDAIHTLQIFESDSLISVRAEQDMFFQHDGSGMKPILGMEKFTKLEREMLYRYTGGVILTQTEKFIKNQELITGRVGHIEIDQKSTLRISSDFDLRVVELLLTHSVNS